MITDQIKHRIQSVINIFETGSPDGDYSNISIFSDGPGNCKQITYGRSQTTEFSSLNELVEMYVNADGEFSKALKPYVGRIGKRPSLYLNEVFKSLLKKAGKDEVMKKTQDSFFDKVYWTKAFNFFKDNGFTNPLSLLVIYDSFIHGGLSIVRKKFSEKTPASGGDEKKWISNYCLARRSWLENHPRKILHSTSHRPALFSKEIKKGNWDMSEKIPVEQYFV